MLFRKFKIMPALKNFLMALALILVVYFAEAQELMSFHSIAGSIAESDLKMHLEVLAHDSLEGRETGQPGQKKAAKYLASQFAKMGLEPVPINGQASYFQSIPLFRMTWQEVSITVQGKKYEHMKDIICLKSVPSNTDTLLNVVFAGYGNGPDFRKLDIAGKNVVLVYDGEGRNWEDRAKAAKQAGVKYIFIIYGKKDEDIDSPIRLYSKFHRSSELTLNKTSEGYSEDPAEDAGAIFFIQPGMAEKIFGTSLQTLRSAADKSLKSKYRSLRQIPDGNLTLKLEYAEQSVSTENVIGMVKGLERPDEVVMVTAHYDHVGIRDGQIYNGADDNGSGTSAVLELAEAFSIAARNNLGPKKSVIFLLLTGEEKGLLGSKYYVANPVFPLEQTAADFNIDMIGRIDSKHQGNPDYVYLIGSDKISLEFHELSERVNQSYSHLDLDYTYNEDSDPNRFYYRSDHYNFAKEGIPVIFYFTGVHDDYHRPTDVIDKIHFDRMERITKLIFYTAWEVANMDRKLRIE